MPRIIKIKAIIGIITSKTLISNPTALILNVAFENKGERVIHTQEQHYITLVAAFDTLCKRESDISTLEHTMVRTVTVKSELDNASLLLCVP